MKKASGFTVIELLVTVSVISLLSSVVLSSLSGTREQARESGAQAQLRSLHQATQQLLNDTGKWPGGCPPQWGATNVLVYLDDKEVAGLTKKPQEGEVPGYYPTGGTPCEWTAEDLTQWDGPYVSPDKLIDPWGNPLIIDTHYHYYTKYKRGVIPPDPEECPKEVMNTEYTGYGPKIYSQAQLTTGRKQGRAPNDNPTDYHPTCDDVRRDLGPQKEY